MNIKEYKEDLELQKELLPVPGEYIQEILDFENITQKELALRMGKTTSNLNQIIKGETAITEETALSLEYALGNTAAFWLGLERKYQDRKLGIKRLERLIHSCSMIERFPIKELQRRSYIADSKDKLEVTNSLLKFLRVSSEQVWNEANKMATVLFKIDSQYTTDVEAISSWLRIGEIEAEKLSLPKFNKSSIKKRIADIQKLCFEAPTGWLEKLQAICAECGIALIYTPSIPKAPIYGAAKWIKGNTLPIIQLTDRQKSYNSFWFSFYHELGHIILHGKTEVFLEVEGVADIPNEIKEKEADDYAIKHLIDSKKIEEISKHTYFGEEFITKLSDSLEIHPSILIAYIQRNNQPLYKDAKLNAIKNRQRVVFDNY